VANSPLEKKLLAAGLTALSIPRTGFFSRLRALSKILRDYQPQVILCQHLHDLWLLIPLVYFKNIRTIGLSHTFLGVSKKDPLHSLLYQRLDSLICLTSLHKKNLQQHLLIPDEKIEVIPNMVDVKKFSPTFRSGFLHDRYKIDRAKLLLGVIGRLDEHKGQLEAVLAIEYLKAYANQIHLLIVGEDTINSPGTEAKLRALVQEKGLQNMVTFTGFISPVESAMASLDILLVPSHAETFGRTIIEGMASGVPVISTRAGGVPDIITENVTGLLVRPWDSQDLANAIEKLILQPELRLKLGQQGLEHAHADYSKEIVVKKWRAVISAS
jgi:glycosyltransferase involved in cell wall biosynthesis